jgi:hypothetical protein
VDDAAAGDPRASGDRGAARDGHAAGLWAKLPEDLQGVIAARVFAPAAAADDPPPLAARRLAPVSKGFAAQAGRIDWDMAALRWDCRAFADGKLRAPAFAVRVARVVIDRERRMPGNRFPLTVYQEVYDCGKQVPMWQRYADAAWEADKRRQINERINTSMREFHEAFGQRECSAHETRARHQGIVARRIHEARLDEVQKVLVIGRLDRMFQGINVKLQYLANVRHALPSDRPDYISVRDSLKRDVALLASM